MRARKHLGKAASLDSTGWDAAYVSRYFLKKRAGRCQRHRPWVKSTLVCDHATHLIFGHVRGRGPSNDAAFFPAAARQATTRYTPSILSADAAYDAEPFHRLCRTELGIRRTAIPINPRRTGSCPKPRAKFRSEMYSRFPLRLYRQRSHAECVISQCKRRLGPNLHARSDSARGWEADLKIIAFNTLLLAARQRK